MPISEERLEELEARLPSRIVGPGNDAPVHLFHAPNSICSQKVRATLFALDLPFRSHAVDLAAGESYNPVYVRTRAEKCQARGLPFASTHDGGSSVADFGCDACVVPTLIAVRTREVIIDSLAICRDLARGSATLRPADLEADVEREIGIVDRLQNYGLLAPKLAARTRPARGRARGRTSTPPRSHAARAASPSIGTTPSSSPPTLASATRSRLRSTRF